MYLKPKLPSIVVWSRSVHRIFLCAARASTLNATWIHWNLRIPNYFGNDCILVWDMYIEDDYTSFFFPWLSRVLTTALCTCDSVFLCNPMLSKTRANQLKCFRIWFKRIYFSIAQNAQSTAFNFKENCPKFKLHSDGFCANHFVNHPFKIHSEKFDFVQMMLQGSNLLEPKK